MKAIKNPKNQFRFFVEQKFNIDSAISIRDKNQIKKIKSVLRCQKGDKIELFNGDGYSYLAIIQSITISSIVAHIVEKIKGLTKPKIKISLAVCLSFADDIKSVIQKAVELGVYQIIPVISQTSGKINKQICLKKEQRWQKIIIQAAQQCQINYLTKLKPIISFEQLIIQTDDYANKIILDTQTSHQNWQEFKNKDCLILLGPKGDFTTDEYQKAKNARFISLSLGKRILKVETAAITAINYLNFLNL